MNATLPPETIITPDICRDYIDQVIFKLRPGDYKEKYPIWPGMVGLELEMLLVKQSESDHSPAPIPLQGDQHSLVAMLKPLAEKRNWAMSTDQGSDGQALVMKFDMSQQDALTFEPGGQLEFSSRPYPCLQDAVRRLRSVQELLDTEAQKHGWSILQLGANPWHSPDELGLQMPKQRYQAMDRYFSGIGPFGRRMMRQTCTIQTCLDFGATETQMAKRYLASQLLAPFSAAIFAYSPFIDGAHTKIPGFRTKVWKNLDRSRTGITNLSQISQKLDKASCVEAYYQFAMNAGVVFIESLGYQIPKTPMSFQEWISGSGQAGSLPKPTLKDFETHLSLLFPEVRPRGFLELRSVDCQARPWQIVPAAFSTGLLYNDHCLDQTIETLLPYRQETDNLWEFASEGLKHPGLAQVSKKLMQLAFEGFKLLPPCFRGEGTEKALQIFAERFTLKDRTPSDDLTDALITEGKNVPGPFQIKRIEEGWFADLA